MSNGWGKAFAALGSSVRRVCSGYVGIIALGLIGTCVGLLVHEKQNQKLTVPVSEFLDVLSEINGIENSPVTFKDEAILHRWSVADKRDHIVVTMVWEVLERQQRVRFVHICDEQENLLYNVPANVETFRGAPKGSILVDHCKIYKNKIREKAKLEQPSKKYIGIGFWAKGNGTAPADRGQLQMGNRRLLVGQFSPGGIIKLEEN